MVVEIRQLVSEISSFLEVVYKRGDLKDSFLIKLQAGNLKLSEGATADVL